MDLDKLADLGDTDATSATAVAAAATAVAVAVAAAAVDAAANIGADAKPTFAYGGSIAGLAPAG